jgi:ABC-2 type transport system ATP-binding protein
MSATIELQSVYKQYGPNTIIHNVSFTVEHGEIVGFLGPNGAGKTTTMRMIAGYTTTSSGSIRVAGFDMATENERAAEKIGYLPEHPPLYDTLDVETYLRFVAKIKGVPTASIPRNIDRVVAACRLETVFRREIHKLSKGYRQRTGLAQALLGNPEVLLLDEPTAGLDPGQIHETREVIRSFGEHHAVLISTHILPEVTLICNRVAIIKDGRLLAIDSPAGLQQASEKSSRVSLEVSAPQDTLREELLGIDGVQSVTVAPVPGDHNVVSADCHVEAREGIEAAIARVVSNKWDLHQLARHQPTLENVFLRYIGESEREEA